MVAVNGFFLGGVGRGVWRGVFFAQAGLSFSHPFGYICFSEASTQFKSQS